MLRARQSERSEAPRSARWCSDEEDEEDGDEEDEDEEDVAAAAAGDDVNRLVDKLSDAMQSGGNDASG
jgi:hypothetical protein